jgi:hypothetical protein
MRTVEVSAESVPTPCQPVQLRLSWDADVAAASGNNPVLYRLANRSRRSCLLEGDPDLRFFDGKGRLMPFQIVDGGDIMITSKPPKPVVVRPRASAWVEFNKYRCDLGERAQATRAEMRLQKTASARPIHLSYYPSLCANTSVTSITVSPFEARRNDVFNHF